MQLQLTQNETEKKKCLPSGEMDPTVFVVLSALRLSGGSSYKPYSKSDLICTSKEIEDQLSFQPKFKPLLDPKKVC